MKAESANSPADVFISVDSGRLERARDGAAPPLSSAAISRGAAELRDPDDPGSASPPAHASSCSTRTR
jgi:ABC-type Fe3+ transport system substrate-binding protein